MQQQPKKLGYVKSRSKIRRAPSCAGEDAAEDGEGCRGGQVQGGASGRAGGAGEMRRDEKCREKKCRPVGVQVVGMLGDTEGSR